jgi:hypothetical protein
MITPLCMRTSAPFSVIFAVALLTGAGCDDATTRLPTTPVAPSTPVIPQGVIAVLSVEPGTGATLTAEECDGGWCVVDLNLAVEVSLNQPVAKPWVTVSFNSGSQQCASSGYPTVFQTLEPLRANTDTSFTVSGLGLSHPTGGTLCRLPQTTDKMVVQLWAERGRSSTALLTREFAYSYTFVLP